MATSHATDLQHQYRDLLRKLQLPDTVMRADAPPLLKRIDLSAARQLLQACEAWNERGVFDEDERLIHDVLLKSAETRQAFLASEIEALQRLAETGEDQLHRGPHGLIEWFGPVMLRGHQVHIIRSGKFRETAFADRELQELAFQTGIARKSVDAAAQAVPVRNGESLASFIRLHQRLRDALAAALDAQLQSGLLGQGGESAENLANLGAMAEGAAHQFSNLLSVILGYSSLVLAKSELTAEAASALNRISEAAQKGRRLTEEILTLAGAQREEESSCSLHDRLQNALALLQAERPQASSITLDLSAELDQVPAAPGTVHARATNLLRHALESAAEGAALRVATHNVTENGIQQIVAEVLEGSQRKESPARIVFPIFSGIPQRTAKNVRRRLAPSHIWVADDDPVVREMCQRVLSAEGHTVREASSGVELQGLFDKKNTGAPDLVIYDFSMPDVDGVELINWLRQKSLRVPVILISGFTAEHPDLKQALQQRKVFLLQKPFSFRDMSDLVTIAMGETLVG